MTKAVIYRPDKNAMQSGTQKSKAWLLKFKPEKPYFVDNLMSWVGMTDMPQEVQLTFPSKEAAIAYAKAQNIPFDLLEPPVRKQRLKAYADNFKYDRMQDQA